MMYKYGNKVQQNLCTYIFLLKRDSSINVSDKKDALWKLTIFFSGVDQLTVNNLSIFHFKNARKQTIKESINFADKSYEINK